MSTVLNRLRKAAQEHPQRLEITQEEAEELAKHFIQLQKYKYKDEDYPYALAETKKIVLAGKASVYGIPVKVVGE